MSGTPLAEFTAFAESQGPAWLTSAEDVINDVSRNTYTWTRLLGAHSMEDMIQGGDLITDRIFLSSESTYERYNPNASFTYQNTQPGTNMTLDWAFAKFDVSWTKQEVGLNKNTMTASARAQKYKDLLRQKHQNAWTDACNKMDDELWALPNRDLMEDTDPTGPKIPYSINTFINEHTNALPTAACDANGELWTTKERIAPATYSNWVPRIDTYEMAALPTTAGACGPLLNPFTASFMATTFDRLPKRAEYADKTTSPNFIAASLWGIQLIEHCLRISQDAFYGMKSGAGGGGSDPAYPYPVFRGVPFDYISKLDTAAIYPTGASAVFAAEDSTAGTTNAGPRYYGINAKYMKMILHSENFLAAEDVITPSAQPFSRVQIWDIWNQFMARSLRRHFIIGPGGTADVIPI